MSWLANAVSAEERTRIEAALASCTTVSLTAGSSLDADRLAELSLVAIEQGCVFVSTVRSAARRRMVVALAGGGSLLLPPGAGEQIEALANSRLTLVPEDAQRALLAIPSAASAIAEGLTVRLRDCQESLSQFSRPRHVDRLRLKLAQLARVYGKAGAGGVWLSLPLTHEVLAGMVGSTRETVTRAMAQLMREGFLRHERGAYRLALPGKTSGFRR